MRSKVEYYKTYHRTPSKLERQTFVIKIWVSGLLLFISLLLTILISTLGSFENDENFLLFFLFCPGVIAMLIDSVMALTSGMSYTKVYHLPPNQFNFDGRERERVLETNLPERKSFIGLYLWPYHPLAKVAICISYVIAAMVIAVSIMAPIILIIELLFT